MPSPGTRRWTGIGVRDVPLQPAAGCSTTCARWPRSSQPATWREPIRRRPCGPPNLPAADSSTARWPCSSASPRWSWRRRSCCCPGAGASTIGPTATLLPTSRSCSPGTAQAPSCCCSRAVASGGPGSSGATSSSGPRWPPCTCSRPSWGRCRRPTCCRGPSGRSRGRPWRCCTCADCRWRWRYRPPSCGRSPESARGCIGAPGSTTLRAGWCRSAWRSAARCAPGSQRRTWRGWSRNRRAQRCTARFSRRP